MKITIFSFDLWGFNKKIANELTKQGHKVNYVNTAVFKYGYPHFGYRILNFFSKNIIRVNIKKGLLRKTIIKNLTNNTKLADIIFMVNPGYFPSEYTEIARKNCKKLIAYNYDSLKRVPLPQNYNNLFDEIYCFDDEDIKNSLFQHRTNFNYISNIPLGNNHKIKHIAFAIQSVDDDRLFLLSKIADAFDKTNHKNYLFFVKDKKNKHVNKNIIFIDENKNLEEVENYTKESLVLIDLIREDQTGLSFRFFEAMAYQKKIITTNKNVSNYDFYNPQNILILNPDEINIPNEFLESPYQEIPTDIFKKYTLESWVKTIFN